MRFLVAGMLAPGSPAQVILRMLIWVGSIFSLFLAISAIPSTYVGVAIMAVADGPPVVMDALVRGACCANEIKICLVAIGSSNARADLFENRQERAPSLLVPASRADSASAV